MKPGQQVVCTKKDNWVTVYGQDQIRVGPHFNEIVTIEDIRIDQDGGWVFLVLGEYGSKYGYSSRHFEPLLSLEDLAEALDNVEICEVGKG